MRELYEVIGSLREYKLYERAFDTKSSNLEEIKKLEFHIQLLPDYEFCFEESECDEYGYLINDGEYGDLRREMLQYCRWILSGMKYDYNSEKFFRVNGRTLRCFYNSADASAHYKKYWDIYFEAVSEGIKYLEHELEEMGYGGAWDDRCLYFGDYEKSKFLATAS